MKDLGYLAYQMGDLKQANIVLKECGPETFTGDRIRIKKDTTVSNRNHIEIASFTGN